MSYKQVPITAKILKTTKGGVTQPLLNMGAPVKMKAPSPAQQTGSFGEGYQKRMAEKKEAAKQKRAEADKNTYNKKLDQYKKDVAIADKSSDGKGKKNYIARGRAESFSKELFDFDKKNYPNRTKDFKTATDYAKSKINKSKKEESKTLTPENLKARSEGEAGWAADDKARKNKTGIYKPAGKKSYDQAYKDRDKKAYGKMDKAAYIKEAKRQNASKKAGKGYDVKNKTVNTSNNASTSNDVATTKVTKKQTDIQSAKNNVAVNTKEKVNTKVTVKPTSRQVRKNASADRKDSRAKRVSVKAEEARASGNTTKADRLDRRVGRIKKRANKKRGQAAGAIQPK